MGEVSTQIGNAIGQVTQIIRDIANPIGVLALVLIGITFMASTNDSTREKMKSWFIRLVIGMLIINLAETIMGFISTIGQ